MPVAKVTGKAEPPSGLTISKEYPEIYKALYAAESNEWISIEITHTKETRLKEINNIRRACQRFFAQKSNSEKYHMVSAVSEGTPGLSSIMYVQKAVRPPYDAKEDDS
jgi:hypothetical protein